MRTMLDERVLSCLTSDPALRAKLSSLEAAVADSRLSPAVAVEEIVALIGL